MIPMIPVEQAGLLTASNISLGTVTLGNTGLSDITSSITIPTGYKVLMVGLANFTSSNLNNASKPIYFSTNTTGLTVYALGEASYSYSNISVNVIFAPK